MTDKCDLIEIHVVTGRAKSEEYMQKLGNAIVKNMRENIGEHFARYAPRVYIADIRGSEDEAFE